VLIVKHYLLAAQSVHLTYTLKDIFWGGESHGTYVTRASELASRTQQSTQVALQNIRLNNPLFPNFTQDDTATIKLRYSFHQTRHLPS
jgi:hypothetical protein